MRISKLMLAAVFIFSGVALAQETRYPYQAYEDRKEGIVKERQLVAGEKLVLVSAAIAHDQPAPKGQAQVFSMGFYLPSETKLKVVLREYSKAYKLELLQQDYAAGVFRYSWPAEIPQFYQIGLGDLRPLVKVSEPGSRTLH